MHFSLLALSALVVRSDRGSLESCICCRSIPTSHNRQFLVRLSLRLLRYLKLTRIDLFFSHDTAQQMRPPSRAVALPIPTLVFSLLVFAVAPVAAAASRSSSNLPGFVRMMPSRTSSPPASTSLTAPGPAASAPSRSQANTRSTPSTVTASSWFGGDGSKSKDPQVLVRQGNVVDDTRGKGAVHVVRVSSYLTKGAKACFLCNVGNCKSISFSRHCRLYLSYFHFNLPSPTLLILISPQLSRHGRI